MRKSIILTTAAVFVVGVASANLVAQRVGGPGRGDRAEVAAGGEQGPRGGGPDGRGFGGGRFGGRGFGSLGRGLDLTAEQRTAMQDIARASRDKVGPIARELREAQSDLRSAMFAETRDAAAVATLTTRVTELRTQMAEARAGTSAAVAAILTPEQREQVRSGTERRPGVGRGGPGRGPGRGAGRGNGPATRG